MTSRRNAPGHTHRAGLGWAHQQARQRALAALQDGDPCARCAARGIEHPMHRDLVTRRPDGRLVAPLLDLDDWPGRRYGGPQDKRLSWASCNRRAGQAVTAAILRNRGAARRAVAYSRW